MQIAVLSDLHLGRKNTLDRFARKHGHVEPRFLQLLDHLECNVDKIVLNGDIFETFKCPPGMAGRELIAVLESYPEIAKRVIDNPKYQLVHGNHDRIAERVLGAPEFYEVEDHGTKMCFFHGHQLDPLNRGVAWLPRTGVWLGCVLERFGFHVTPHDMKRMDPDGRHRLKQEPFTVGALAIGAERGADVVITGHTHRA